MKNKNTWRFVGFLYGQNLCHIQFSPVARQPKQRHGQSNGVRETTSQRLVTSGGVYVRTSRVYEYQPGEGNSLQVSRIRFRFCRLNNRARRLPNHDNIILGCSGNLPRILRTP